MKSTEVIFHAVYKSKQIIESNIIEEEYSDMKSFPINKNTNIIMDFAEWVKKRTSEIEKQTKHAAVCVYANIIKG